MQSLAGAHYGIRPEKLAETIYDQVSLSLKNILQPVLLFKWYHAKFNHQTHHMTILGELKDDEVPLKGFLKDAKCPINGIQMGFTTVLSSKQTAYVTSKFVAKQPISHIEE